MRRPTWSLIDQLSPGGITAWLYEEHSLPIINLAASFKGGAALDPPGQEGVTSTMAALLTEGAGALDATAFAEAGERIAAYMGISASRDSVDIWAQALTESRGAVPVSAGRVCRAGERGSSSERIAAQVSATESPDSSEWTRVG